MAQKLEHIPGDVAPIAGIYEQLNVMGQPTGVRAAVARNQQIPAAPLGYTWTLAEEPATEC
jgi:hypothetical protein